jgi:hypothetical protein
LIKGGGTHWVVCVGRAGRRAHGMAQYARKVGSAAKMDSGWWRESAAKGATAGECSGKVTVLATTIVRIRRYRFPGTDLNSKATLIKPVGNSAFK